MLSQRMAKAYLFRQMGSIRPRRAACSTRHEGVRQGPRRSQGRPQSTAQIKSELALVEQQWFFFQNALQMRAATDRVKAASDVGTTSERILEQMDLVVGLYERL
jgi:hypothetical protein